LEIFGGQKCPTYITDYTNNFLKAQKKYSLWQLPYLGIATGRCHWIALFTIEHATNNNLLLKKTILIRHKGTIDLSMKTYNIVVTKRIIIVSVIYLFYGNFQTQNTIYRYLHHILPVNDLFSHFIT